MRKFGVKTALEFARREEDFIKKHLSKSYREIWHELNGRSIYPVVPESKSSYQSISKAKTFTPPSNDAAFVFAQLSKNIEAACIKARRYRLAATRLIVFLRTQAFEDRGIEFKLNRSTAYPSDLFGALKEGFHELFNPETLYRQTGVVIAGLVQDSAVQYTLFEDASRIEKMAKIYDAVDLLSEKFGKYALHHGSSLLTKLQARHEGERGDAPRRVSELFKGENSRQRLGLPMLHIKV